MTARWECSPPWWPAEAGAWPWGYRHAGDCYYAWQDHPRRTCHGAITGAERAGTTAAAAARAAAFIAQTRRFIAETDAELHAEARRRGCADPGR